MGNFALRLSEAAAADREHAAVKLDDITLDYGTLDAAVARTAGLLTASGISPGDRLALQLPNIPYFPIVYFAALRVGAVVVPMNPLLKGPEVEYQLADSGAKVIVAWHGMADAAKSASDAAGSRALVVQSGEFEQTLARAEPVEATVDREPDDPAVIIYTSGTTGTPKGATLTHRNISAAAEIGRELVDAGPDVVTVGTLPLFHVFGMNCAMNVTVVARGLLTLVPRFKPETALRVIERDRATTFTGVPTMYAAMFHHPGHDAVDTSSLELCVSGGAALPLEVLRGFEEAFGCKILEGYGLSETTGMGCFNRPDEERKPGSIGLPVRDTRVRVVDDESQDVPPGEPGEIILRGPFVMSGYWNRPDATEETLRDGWLHTGDIAKVDEDGYIFIVDRKKELIIRGGYNVYPREIEEVLYTHPAIREAAVIGVPHEALGEEVAAAVVLREGGEASPEELRSFAKERVAAYKYPRLVWIVEDLPKGATGKILKRAIEVPDAVLERSG